MSIDILRARLRRPALRLEVGGFRPDDSPHASWFGRVNLGLPGEVWPQAAGAPMLALFQLNLAGLPFRPPRLADVGFLTAFIAPNELPSGTPNGDGWCLRAYRTHEALVPLAKPTAVSPIRASPMRALPVEDDFPCWEDVPAEVAEAFETASEEEREALANASGFKLGGWPTLIQSEIYWAPMNQHPARPEFVLQVDSEPQTGWAWGDGGVGYFGRGTTEGFEDTWVMEWQCL